MRPALSSICAWRERGGVEASGVGPPLALAIISSSFGTGRPSESVAGGGAAGGAGVGAAVGAAAGPVRTLGLGATVCPCSDFLAVSKGFSPMLAVLGGSGDAISATALDATLPPVAFTVWFAGAGIQGGTVHGATDELGFHITESPHYVTDIKILEKGKKNPMVKQGVLLAKNKRWDEALQTWERARDLRPDDPAVFNDLGVAHEIRGDLDQAEENYRQALKLNPHSQRYMQNLNHLDHLRTQSTRLKK